jgi:hypothetical protein
LIAGVESSSMFSSRVGGRRVLLGER